MLAAYRQMYVRMGRSQGETRALRGQKEERKGKGPRWEPDRRQYTSDGGKWGGKWEAGTVRDGTLAGRVRTCYSQPCLQPFAGYWVHPNSLIPAEAHLPLLWGSPAGICTVLGQQRSYHKSQIHSRGVFPLLGRGRDFCECCYAQDPVAKMCSPWGSLQGGES